MDLSQFNISFLEYVREVPAIWQPRNPLYINKKLKEAAWEEIAIKLKHLFPNSEVTSEALKKKYKNLKTQLLREDKKIKNAKSGSAGGEKVPWKLYEHAKFMLGSNISKEFASSSLTKNDAPVLSWKNSVPSTSHALTIRTTSVDDDDIYEEINEVLEVNLSDQENDPQTEQEVPSLQPPNEEMATQSDAREEVFISEPFSIESNSFPVPKGRPVKRRRGVTSGNQAYLLGLLEQGIESIGNHAKEVDERLNDIQEIKRDVQAIHSVILMRQDSNLGDIVILAFEY